MKLKLMNQKMFLAGKWVTREQQIEVRNPEDNTIIETVPAASVEDMIFCIEEAKEGAKLAAKLPIHKRMDIIRKAALYVEDHFSKFAITIANEGCKTIKEAKKEVTRAIETLRISAEEARRIEGKTINFDQMPGSETRHGYYYRCPIGIIGAITPFNDPLNLVAHKVGPAIASGNAIIVKPATETPLSALLLAEAFEYAGLPEKILSVVSGYGREIGDILITDPSVRMISFTGGREVGEAITRKAGLKKISMELGSNSPVIVLKDANLGKAVDSTVSGAFWAAGQNCLSVQRIYVEAEIYEQFEEKFVEKTKHVRVGPKLKEQTDIGPLINEKEAIRVERLIKDATTRGAIIKAGGKRVGNFVEPTVLTNVNRLDPIAQEEIFGPVVMLFPVGSLDVAIAEANAVDYGLQAGIFTNNLKAAQKAIFELEVGAVMVNDSSDYRIDAMPFGGVKGSGLGREGIAFAIEEMTEQKVVCYLDD
ncbi:aldehyde dehydrogenase family protein [Alkalihalobacillus sp. 1P02AB]|uniref:aldehyde dehydrogenase family protein n=1 Tax=Alkalihalobacillus sp. 1P02AB TaxID=3132260 RepID=UPI0039A4D4D0